MNNNCSKLSACALGLTIGIVWALSVVFCGLGGMMWEGWALSFNNMLGEMYIGFNLTYVGIAIGGAWAFVDGLIMGLLVGWIYNWLLGRCKSGSCG